MILTQICSPNHLFELVSDYLVIEFTIDVRNKKNGQSGKESEFNSAYIKMDS